MNPLDILGAISGVAGKVTDKLLAYIPDPEQRLKAMQEVAQMDLSADAQQISVNLEEAKSEKWWKAGWRPFVGWICGAALGYTYILQPFLLLALHIWWPGLEAPKLETQDLIGILAGILGLGYYRSKEKQINSN